MKKMLIEIMPSDIKKLIEGLEAYQDTVNKHEEKEGNVEFQLLQTEDTVITLTVDLQGRIKL